MNKASVYLREAEKTLTALDGAQELEPSPYLATRVLAAVQQQSAPTGWPVLRPRMAGLLLAALLLVNLLTLLAFAGFRREQADKARLINALRQDFNTEQQSSFF